MLHFPAGGEFGSYGAGFLQGWGEIGAVARPAARNDIQIVTGVSTGALMATHAFVGGMDDTLGSEPVCPGAPRVSGQRPRFQ